MREGSPVLTRDAVEAIGMEAQGAEDNAARSLARAAELRSAAMEAAAAERRVASAAHTQAAKQTGAARTAATSMSGAPIGSASDMHGRHCQRPQRVTPTMVKVQLTWIRHLQTCTYKSVPVLYIYLHSNNQNE